MTERLDLVVVGGGPAGLATAIAARLAGLSVRVLDRARPPIDKACGEGLMPDAVRCLAALGVELPAAACRRFRGIRYLDGEAGLMAEGIFPGAGEAGGADPVGEIGNIGGIGGIGDIGDIGDAGGIGDAGHATGGGGVGGLGVRRLVLHQALVHRAAEVGAELCWGVAVSGLAPADRPADKEAAAPDRSQPPRLPAGIAGAADSAATAGAAATPAAAAGSGADLGAWGGIGKTPVRGVATADGVVEARWVVGADGLRSQVRRWAGLEGPRAARRRFGVRRHYACRPWSDLVEVHWGPGCEAYVTPVGPAEVGVALLWEGGSEWRGRSGEGTRAAPRPRSAGRAAGACAAAGTDLRPAILARPACAAGADLQPASAARRSGAACWNAGEGAGGAARCTFDRLLAHFPALTARLAGAPAVSRDRGAGPLAQRVRRTIRGNVALVGDAAGYLDAITGEGLAVTLHQALALARTLARAKAGGPAGGGLPVLRGAVAAHGSLAPYAAACRRIARLPDLMTSLVLALERRPWLRRRALGALAAEPALFGRLLGIHARTLPPAQLGLDGALRLVYRLVTA